MGNGECAHCGAPLRPPPPRGRPPKFCNPTCKEGARTTARQAALRQALAARCCEHCGKTLADKRTGKARFCSPGCNYAFHNAARSAANLATKVASRKPCEGCGSAIPETARSNARYCSRDCMHKTVTKRNYDPARSTDYNRRYLYGIGTAEVEEILAAQGGVCAICGTDQWGGYRGRPHVDHCHKTKKVRGLLCDGCNNGLGRFADDPDRLRAAAAYVEAHR